MSHVEKGERRRQNGGKGGSTTSNGHKTRSERHYRDNGKKNISPKLTNKSLHRTNSQDQVRRLVEQEGRTARNLVTWSVPVADEKQGGNQERAGDSRKQQQVENEREKSKGVSGKRGLSPGAKEKPKARQVRSRSTSANRKKFDLRARYWSYLFDNLKRAVDEIYTTCETDESVMECQEVIMMLDQCRNDFHALIERIQLQAAFEKADSKDRPQSLAWAVRKLSPGKNAAPSPPPGFACEKTLKNAARALEFEAKTDDNILSWADRVKGRPSVHDISHEAKPADETSTTHEERLKQNGFVAISDENMVEDGEGWETVCYNKKTKSPEKSEIQNVKQAAFKNTKNLPNAATEPSSINNGNNNSGKYTAKNITNSKPKNAPLEEPVFEAVEPVLDSARREQNRVKLDHKPVAQEADSLKNAVNKTGRSVIHGEPVIHEIEPVIHEIEPVGSGTQLDEPVLREIASLKELAVVKLERCPEDEVLLKGLILSPITGESDLDSEGEDALTASDVEHQKALTAAIEQEADLSMELEKEQELYLASAKEHEEKLAKEKAYQEAYVNALNNGNKNGRRLEEDDEQESETKEDEETKENPHDSFTRELTWEEIIAEYDEKRNSGSSSSWGDIVESVEYEGRPPGRAVQMHKKLSSPSRKRDLTDGLQKQTEKQEKAQLLREQILDEKLQHLQTLSEKVAKARELKMMLVGRQESHFREKQRRAEEKRNIKIKEKVRKAQEEEAKVNEIAFINTLEAQNKKMEVLSRHQDHEARLQDLQEERQRKRDEQQAKETAAYERRKQLEAERKARLDEMKQKRQDQEAKFLREKQEKEKAREEAAKEKAREREQRLAARNEALQTAVEQLQLRIKQKQQESTKRHEQMLEFVKEKAAGASRHSTQDDLPNVTPYERKKICTLCNVQIVSEVYLVSHLRGKKHQQAIEELQKERKVEDADTLSLQYIKETGFDKSDDNSKASEERKSAFKKRAKKIRARMASRGRDYEATLSDVTKPQESTKKSKIQKVVKDLERYLKTPSSGPWAANRVAALDRSLGELTRLLESKVTADQVTFCFLGGLSTLCRILLLMEVTSDVQKPFLPPKTLCSVVTVMTFACTNCPETSWYLLLSNKLSIIVDLLAYNLTTLCSNISEKKNNEKDIGRIGDQFLTNLQRLMSTALHSLLSCDSKTVKNVLAGLQPQVCTQRITDLISYVVCLGVVDNLQTCFSSLAGPLENDQVTTNFLLESLETLVAIAKHHSVRTNDVFNEKRDDPSQFMISVKHTGLVGIITLLYSVLLSDGLRVPSKLPEQLSDEMDAMATKGLRFLNYLATADLAIVQSVLGCEGISLQFRHIIGHSLRVCSVEKNYELLHEVILVIGYFTVLNSDNQVFVQSGRPPTLLQKLCSLPFQYFSNPRLRNILFPTLICSCYQNKQNKEIVEQEVSCALLNNYLEDQCLDLQETTATKSIEKLDEMSKRMSLFRRFPVSHWKTAQEFLSPENS